MSSGFPLRTTHWIWDEAASEIDLYDQNKTLCKTPKAGGKCTIKKDKVFSPKNIYSRHLSANYIRKKNILCGWKKQAQTGKNIYVNREQNQLLVQINVINLNIMSVHNMAPNVITSIIRQCKYSGYFGFVQYRWRCFIHHFCRWSKLITFALIPKQEYRLTSSWFG